MRLSRSSHGESTTEQSKPHVWIWHEEQLSGGTVRFLLREGELELSDGERQKFGSSFRKITGVVHVGLYDTYLSVEWSGIRQSRSFEEFEVEIVQIGLPLLAEYFAWQGKLRVGRVSDRAERNWLRQQEGLAGRWIPGGGC